MAAIVYFSVVKAETEIPQQTLQRVPINTVSQKKVEVRGWNPDKKEIIVGPILAGNDPPVIEVVLDPTSITSLEELEAFAANLANQDSNIKLIKLTSESIELDYQYEGRLFGVFPIKAWTRAFIGNDNRVKLKNPWYDIFIKKSIKYELSDSESDLSKLQIQGLQNELQKQAWSLQLISNIMKTKHDTVKNSINNIR